MSVYAVDKLIGEARRLAAEYRRATGKTLAISGEIAVHDACTLLQLDNVTDQQLGYDAFGTVDGLAQQRVLVKGRAIFDDSKSGQRIGQLRMDKDWDWVTLVLMDENFEVTEVYIASRDQIEEELQQDTSKRASRGIMSVARFRNLGTQVWTRESGHIDPAT